MALTELLTALADAPRPIFDSHLLTIHDPRTIGASYVALELLVIVASLLTLRHARREQRRTGSAYAPFVWASIVAYGLLIELLTYNTIDNFAHGKCTVMLYDARLPLYVVALYPLFLYTAIASVDRLRLGKLAGFFVTGLAIVLIDVPYDIQGPDRGWWRWFDGDADPGGLVAHRWLGVPVTSYCWHLLFGGSLALTVGGMRGAVERCLLGRGGLDRLARFWGSAACAAVVTVILGVLVMMPFHGFRAVGLSDGVFAGTTMAVAAIVALVSVPRAAAEAAGSRPDWLLFAPLGLWSWFFLTLGIITWSQGQDLDWPLKAAVSVAVIVCSVVLATILQLRGRPDEVGGELD